MPETGGASGAPKKGLTLDDLIATIARHERNPSNIPKVDTFDFCGERVSEWLERVEQALVGGSDIVKFQHILQYVLHSYHQEVKKVIDAAQGSWERFKEGMQRKYRLGDGLLTTADLEAMKKEDFTTIGGFVQKFKKRAWKVHGISKEAQCAIFLGLLTASEAVELTRHGGGSTKLTWATIDRGVEVGCLDQVEQRQVRLQRQKRKERDATTSGTPGVTRIVTDVLAQVGYATEPVVQRRVVTAVKVKGKESVIEEVVQEELWEEEELVPQHLTKVQHKVRNLAQGGQGSGKTQAPQAQAAAPLNVVAPSSSTGPSQGGAPSYGQWPWPVINAIVPWGSPPPVAKPQTSMSPPIYPTAQTQPLAHHLLPVHRAVLQEVGTRGRAIKATEGGVEEGGEAGMVAEEEGNGMVKARGTKAKGVKARGTKAKGVKARGTKAKGVKARGTKAKGVKARGTKAKGVKARGTKAKGVKARGTKAKGVKARGTKARGTKTKGIKARGIKARGIKARGIREVRDERSGLISSTMDGNIYDQFGEAIDKRLGGVRVEAQRRVAAGPPPPAMFRLWQEKEEPPIGVEEVGSDEEVAQGLRGGSKTEEPIIIESDGEDEEERMEPPFVLFGKMEDLLDKMGRYQQKLVGLCEEVKGWRSNIPEVFLYDSGSESAPRRPGVNVVGSCPQSGMRWRPLTPQVRLAQATRTRNQAKASASQEPPRRETEPRRRKEVVKVEDDEDEEEEDERLRREEDQRTEQQARKKGTRGEAEPVLRDGPPKKKKYVVRLEEGFDVERVIDRLLEGHNDLMTLKEILASGPRLRDELKGRLSRRLVPNVHLGTILPKEAEWVESGTKMDWKCVACGTVDLVVKGSKCAAMVDTGAEMNIIRKADAIRFGLDIDRSDGGILHGVSCKAVFCGTTSKVLIEVEKVKARACFFIMPDVDHGILLGRSFLSRTETVIFNKHDGTLILLLCDPACGNYEIITCRNTWPRSIRNRPNSGSFTIEESEGERRRLRAELETGERVEAFSLSLLDVGKAIDLVAAHKMADPDAIQALREQVLECPEARRGRFKQGSQRRYKTVDKKCRPVPVLVTEDEEAYYERERGLIRRMRESALAGPCRINEGNEGELIIGEPDFLLPQERTLMVELMKRKHRAYAFSDEERGRLDVDKIPMIRIHTMPHEPWNIRGARYPNPDEEKKVVDYLDGKISTHVADYSSGPYAFPWFCFIKPNGTLRWMQDLQRLNAVTVRDAGGLPNADALSESCAGRPIISLIDLYSGYDQFPVYPPDKPWMMELALASSHSLVEDIRTIEEGPGQVERHEDLMGGMYLLFNTLLQESLDQSDSLNPAGNVDEVPESQDDEFEEGEVKEAFRAEEYDGIYLELGLLLSCKMRLTDASDRAQRMLQRYLVRDDHLFVRREVGNPRRVVCGRNRQIDVVAALHDDVLGGHRGVQATYTKISELYYWDGMMDMVRKFCRSCIPCQERSRLRQGEPLHPRLEREVGAVVHLDLLFMPLGDQGYNYIFDARDNLSGFVDGRAICTKTGLVLVSCIVEYYLRYPFVREFVMDRGSEFTYQEVQELLSRYGVAANYTTAEHPQANAPVERGHSTITSLLVKWTEAMPRGGKGTRPAQRPLGASGGYERHGPRHRESTPVYNDGDIELFLDSFWDHARRMGWTVAQAIERLRGAGRFEEPIARIRMEATTRQEMEMRMEELRRSPMGPDGRLIRLEIGNASDFIPTFEWFMQGRGIPRDDWMQTLPLWTRKAERPLASQIRSMVWDWESCKAHMRETFRRRDPLSPELRGVRGVRGRGTLSPGRRDRKKMKEARYGVRLEAMEMEIQELRALVASQTAIIESLRQQTQGRVDRPESSRQGEQRQPGQGLPGQPSAAEPRQEPPMGRVILEPEEARAQRQAEREAFKFRAPTELATLPVAAAGRVVPLAVEEGLPPSSSETAQGSAEGSMGVLLEAVHTMQEEVSLFSPEQRIEESLEREMGIEAEGAIEGRLQRMGTPKYGADEIEKPSMAAPGETLERSPQRLDTPEYVPATGDLRSRLGSWATGSGSGGPLPGTEQQEVVSITAPRSEQQGVVSTLAGSPSSPPLQPRKKKFKRKVDQLCFYCKRSVHHALDCFEFLEDKAAGKVSEAGGKMYDRQ
ncbi:hypothetical protein CBR_g70356, partial [Chara braunii]